MYPGKIWKVAGYDRDTLLECIHTVTPLECIQVKYGKLGHTVRMYPGKIWKSLSIKKKKPKMNKKVNK
jgi:hypothetical protein